MALEMKTNCEMCKVSLAVDDLAFICSYECTFCKSCTDNMQGSCPNCGGELVQRPRRQGGT